VHRLKWFAVDPNRPVELDGRRAEKPGSLILKPSTLEAPNAHPSRPLPARVSLEDLFDVEAPEVGAPRRSMSLLQAYELAKSSEQKAYDFYDEALPGIADPDVRTLFMELRDEEAEHVRMIQEAIAKLPPDANIEPYFDLDESPAL
jgi:hypothetical protein